MFTRNSRSAELVTSCGRNGRSPFSNRHLWAAAVLVSLLASVGTTPGFAQTAPTVSAPAVSSLLVAGQPSTVIATSRIVTPAADPVVITNLLRVDAQGKALYSVGHMRDDGAGGDAVAGDGVFTLQFVANEPAAGPIRLRTFAAFKSSVPVWSDVTVMRVQAASTPIRDAIGDFFVLYPLSSSEISVGPSGEQVALRQLKVVFRSTATAGAVNTLLNSLRATISGSVAGTRALVLRVPDPGSLPALNSLIGQIEADPSVWFVRKGVIPEPNALPENSLDVALHQHLAVKAHAAWNARAAAKNIPNVVVVDFFGHGAPDANLLPHLPVQIIDTNDFSDAIFRASDHGYHVLGIIAGSFGNDSTIGDPRGLVTGMYPAEAGRPVRLRVGDMAGLSLRLLTDLEGEQLIVDRTRALLSQHPARVVINTSYGRAFLLPATLLDAVDWAEMVRAAGLEDRALHLTAAGNDGPSYFAAQASPFAAAALLPYVADEYGQPMPKLTNTLAIENAVTSGVSGVSGVIQTHRPYGVSCLSDTSTVGGHLSAMGTNVFSFTAAGTGFLTGTSMATPQVAGLAAYLWSIAPSRTPRQLADILIATAQPVPTVGGAGCSNWPTPAPTIDAYAAVLALDNAAALAGTGDPTQAPVRMAILDVFGSDGKFDFQDLSDLFTKLTNLSAGALDYSRYDLNGDGYTGLSNPARFDLDISNGSNAWTLVPALEPIQGTSRVFNESALTDMEVLCYYAHSPLYTGARSGPNSRDELLLGHCSKGVTATARNSSVYAEINGAPRSVSPPLESTDFGLFSPDPAQSWFTRGCGAAAVATQTSDVPAPLAPAGGSLTRMNGTLNVKSASGNATVSCLAIETAQDLFEVTFTVNEPVRFNLAGSAVVARTAEITFAEVSNNWFSVRLGRPALLPAPVGAPVIDIRPPFGAAQNFTLPLTQSVVVLPGEYMFRVESRTGTSRLNLFAAPSDISISIDFNVTFTAP